MNRWLEIDLRVIVQNIQIIKHKISWPKVRLMPVIKANAYGHGLVEIAKVCEKEIVDYLAVATFDEAMVLRKNNITLPILTIGYIDKENIEEAIQNNITLSLYCAEEGKQIMEFSQKLNRKAKVHLKLDTGMHRLGFLAKDFIKYYQDILKSDFIEVEYVYSHFADFTNEEYSKKQVDSLKGILEKIKLLNLPVPKVHFSRSDSLNDDVNFEMVRPGLAIYGLNKKIKGIKSALAFKTKIVQIKAIGANEYVGYCLTYKSEKPIKIATIACGYADGYSRNFSNRGEVIIAGKKCPVVGRVCMNLTIVDVSNVSNIKISDEVILIGKDNGAEITVNELAKKIGTISYEIISRIPPEIPRIYKR